LSDFNQNEFDLQVLKKIIKNIKCHENPTSGSYIVTCKKKGGRTDQHRGLSKQSFLAVLRMSQNKSRLILSFVVLGAMQNPNTTCWQNIKFLNVKTCGTKLITKM
jgi:hypothetical protein